MRIWRLAALSLAAVLTAGMLTGCPWDKEADDASSVPAASSSTSQPSSDDEDDDTPAPPAQHTVTINGKEVTITANGKAQDIKLSGDSGKTEGTLTVTVTPDNKVTATIKPESGFAIKSINDTPVPSDKRKEYTVLSLEDIMSGTGNVAIDFAELQTVNNTTPEDANGTVTIKGTDANSQVIEGDKLEITVKANEGYVIESVTVGSETYKPTTDNEETMTVIHEVEPVGKTKTRSSYSLEVKASFTKLYTVTADIGEGGSVTINQETIANNGTLTVQNGTVLTIRAIPNTGYEVDSVKIGEKKLQPADDGSYSYGVSNDCTLSVSFKKQTFTVTVKTSENGNVLYNSETITNKTIQVDAGAEVTLTTQPSTDQWGGWAVSNVTINGERYKSFSDNRILLGAVWEDTTVEVTFGKNVPINISLEEAPENFGSMFCSLSYGYQDSYITFSSSNLSFSDVRVVTGVEGTCQIKCSFNGNGLGGQQVLVSVGKIGENLYDSVILNSSGQGTLKMPILNDAESCWLKIELVDAAQAQTGK